MHHTFTLQTEWTGNTGSGTSGYRDYSRDVVVQSEDAGQLRGSAARVFHGDDSKWNPEQLLLASLAQCHVLAYLHAATQAGLIVTAMTCGVEGHLTVDAEGAGRLTGATLRPTVTLDDDDRRAEADELHALAHSRCFIANSLAFDVEIEPQPTAPATPPTVTSRLGAPLTLLPPRVANRPTQVTGLTERPSEVEPVTTAHSPQPTTASTAPDEQTEGVPGSFYEAVGGRETFEKLVHEFYRGVREDPLLAPMYPQEDFAGAERRLRMFLEQYWGGPKTYSAERGHPRLRMRHMPFTIDAAARDAWLRHMRAALDAVELSPMHEDELWDYLERAAHSLVNSA